jgi:hypothetical protein
MLMSLTFYDDAVVVVVCKVCEHITDGERRVRVESSRAHRTRSRIA